MSIMTSFLASMTGELSHSKHYDIKASMTGELTHNYSEYYDIIASMTGELTPK